MWLWAGLNIIQQQTSSKRNWFWPTSALVQCCANQQRRWDGNDPVNASVVMVAIIIRVRLKLLQNYSRSNRDNHPTVLCGAGEEQKLCVKYRNVFLSWRCHSTYGLWVEKVVMDWVQLWVLFSYLKMLFLWLRHHSQTTKQFSFQEE